jgi:chorismate lyase / 3-hydroxybenzoate synthase
MSMPLRPFAVRYLSAEALADFCAEHGSSILGVIGYGAARPAGLSAATPFAIAPLSTVAGDAVFEVWSARNPVAPRHVGAISGSVADGVAFGLVALEEKPGISLEDLIAQAYRGIFDFLEGLPCAKPIRFWNYLPSITKDADGLERYRRFNIGRHDAFSDRLTLAIPPVASALGSQDGTPVIYFLSAIEPAQTIENPRQVPAYDYPPVYGPRSPRFSRAAVHEAGGALSLLISGTASIVGHTSVHPGDLVAQLGETLENLRLVTSEAVRLGFTPAETGWMLKVYLRHAEDREIVQPIVESRFGASSTYLFLNADICRPDLLVEIEALNLPDMVDARRLTR